MAREGAGPGGGAGRGREGQGRGRKGGFGRGPAEKCICTKCGTTLPHKRGTPCSSLKCPSCGGPMTREM